MFLPEPRTVLAERFEGQPLSFLNDLVVDKNNGIYFTDQIRKPGKSSTSGRRPRAASR